MSVNNGKRILHKRTLSKNQYKKTNVSMHHCIYNLACSFVGTIRRFSSLLSSQRQFIMSAPQWDYSSINGQHKWGEHCKIGNRQSPIDIIHNQTTYDSNLSVDTNSLNFKEDAKCSFDLLNKCVNVSFTPIQDEGKPMQLSGGM